MHGWQWMFILEAIPALILGVVVFFYMTDRPEKANWLKDDERAWLVKMQERPEEPAEKKAPAATVIVERVAEDEILDRIAQRVNADRATEVLEQMRHIVPANAENEKYLATKRVRLGHLLD